MSLKRQVPDKKIKRIGGLEGTLSFKFDFADELTLSCNGKLVLTTQTLNRCFYRLKYQKEWFVSSPSKLG